MAFRIVQKGAGPLVVGFLISPALDAQLKAALPGRAIAMTLDSGVHVTPGEVRAAAVAAGLRSNAEIAAIGYSAGCQGVRKLLRDGVELVAAVCVDGTASSVPPSTADLSLWRNFGAKAKRRDVLFDATCTGQTYVEQLPPGQRFASTVRVLEESLGLKLRVYSDRPPSGLSHGRVTGLPAEGRVGVDFREGALRVLSFASNAIDHAEHAYQGSTVLPRLVAEDLAPFLAARASGEQLEHTTEPAPPPFLIDLDPLRLRLCWALGWEAGLDPREIPGSQHHALIVAYGEACRRGGVFLGVDSDGRPMWKGEPVPVGSPTDEEAWCAKFRSACLLRALRPGETPPHGLRVSVAELVADAKKAGRLRLAGSGYVPSPGDAAILGRAGGNPLAGGTGHVRTMIHFLGSTYVGLGGNESNAIGVATHQTSEVLAWIET